MPTLSSSCTTPNLSRTSTWSDGSDSNASTSGLYTPVDISRQPSTIGERGKHNGLNPQRMLLGSQSLLNLSELESSLNDLDVNPTVRGNVKSVFKRAGTLVKNKLNVTKTFKERRNSVLQRSVNEQTTPYVSDPKDTGTLMDALTPRPTPDIPSICVHDVGELSPNPELLGATPRLRASPRCHSPKHAILHSVYPYLLNPYDNANISATSLLAVCGSPAPQFRQENVPSSIISESWKRILAMPARALCFVPWCALVGACIIISPMSIDKFTPSTSRIMMPTLPAPGPRRFAYWGQSGLHHILIFLFPMIMLMSWNPRIAATLIAGIAAKCWWEWKDCVDRMRNGKGGPVALGKDDMESIYLALTEDHLNDEYQMIIFDKVTTMRDSLDNGDFQTQDEDSVVDTET